MDSETIQNLLLNVRNEFENEIDDYETNSGRELTDDDINIMFEFLDRFVDCVNSKIKDLEYEKEMGIN